MSEVKKKVLAILKDHERAAMELQASIQLAAEKYNKFLDLSRKVHALLVKPDEPMFEGSPISETWTNHWLREFMFKSGFAFVKSTVLEGKTAIPNFLDWARDQHKWILRFARDPEPEKTGIDKIL